MGLIQSISSIFIILLMFTSCMPNSYQEEFSKIKNEKDSIKIENFVEQNISKVSEKMADEMVINYLKIMDSDLKKISNDFFEKKQYDILNNAKNDDGSFNIEKIKDPVFKSYLEELLQKFSIKSYEGDFYLTIDSEKIYKKFSPYVSKSLNEYLKLDALDFKEPIFSGEYLILGPEEIKNRLYKVEELMKSDSNLAKNNFIKEKYFFYMKALTTINLAQGNVDFNNGQIAFNWKKVYLEISNNNELKSSSKIQALVKLLESFDWKMKPEEEEKYKKLNDFREKLFKEI